MITGWLFQPLWKIWKSGGVIIPKIWKNKIPNHQPDKHAINGGSPIFFRNLPIYQPHLVGYIIFGISPSVFEHISWLLYVYIYMYKYTYVYDIYIYLFS